MPHNKDQTKKDRLSASGLSKQKDVCHLTVLSVLPAAHFHTGTLLFMKYKLQQEDTSSRFCGKVWFRQLRLTIAQCYMSLNDFGTLVIGL